MNGLCMPVAIQNDCIIFGLQYETASIRMRERERERKRAMETKSNRIVFDSRHMANGILSKNEYT